MGSNINNNNTKDSTKNSGKEILHSKLGVPGSIILDNKTYIFKSKLKSEIDMYTYRWKNFKYIFILFDKNK